MTVKAPSSSNIKRILCLEEYGETCILLGKMLNHDEYEVLHVKNKVAAYEIMKAKETNLVIIDNNFYKDGAIILAAELKTLRPAIKVMMLSAMDGEIKRLASQVGIDIFLTKPFTKSQFLDSVDSVLNL
jgi:DNA-binding response OmpR family regulator